MLCTWFIINFELHAVLCPVCLLYTIIIISRTYVSFLRKLLAFESFSTWRCCWTWLVKCVNFPSRTRSCHSNTTLSMCSRNRKDKLMLHKLHLKSFCCNIFSYVVCEHSGGLRHAWGLCESRVPRPAPLCALNEWMNGLSFLQSVGLWGSWNGVLLLAVMFPCGTFYFSASIDLLTVFVLWPAFWLSQK